MEIILKWKETKSPGFTGSLSNHICSSQRRHSSNWGTHLLTLLKGHLLFRQCKHCISSACSLIWLWHFLPLEQSEAVTRVHVLYSSFYFIRNITLTLGFVSCELFCLRPQSVIILNMNTSLKSINHQWQIRVSQGYMMFLQRCLSDLLLFSM